MEAVDELSSSPRVERRPARPRPGDRPVRTSPNARALLRRALASPSAVRQAILLREVLGPPVSLRPDHHDRPD